MRHQKVWAWNAYQQSPMNFKLFNINVLKHFVATKLDQKCTSHTSRQ